MSDFTEACAGARRARRRWENAEVRIGLTWGEIIDGSGPVEALQRHGLLTRGGADAARPEGPPPRVLEIGPGYGRFYRSLVERGIDCRFTGLEINAGRVGELRREFPAATWRHADITRPGMDARREEFDLIASFLCFKHLYPDFSAAASRCRAMLAKGATLAFDLPEAHRSDDGAFEEETGCWTRRYTRDEVLALLGAAGYGRIDFGHVDHTPQRRRLLVIARENDSR